MHVSLQAVPLSGHAGVVGWVGDGVSTTEARLIATVGLLLVASEVARAAIDDVDSVAGNPAPAVIPTGVGDSAVTLETRFWIDNPVPPRKWRATREVVQSVKTAFEREGIEIPYPQRELAGRAETGGFRVAEGRRAATQSNTTDD